MMTLIKNMFRKPAAPVAVLDDVPAHKGFEVSYTIDGKVAVRAKFATLAAAQAKVMQLRHESELFRKGLMARGWKPRVKRTFSVRNLETGKFAAYMWTVTHAEMVAA